MKCSINGCKRISEWGRTLTKKDLCYKHYSAIWKYPATFFNYDKVTHFLFGVVVGLFIVKILILIFN